MLAHRDPAVRMHIVKQAGTMASGGGQLAVADATSGFWL